MSLLSQFVYQAVTTVRHPALDSTTCINRRQKRKACTVCKDVCPEDVFLQTQGSSPHWEKCTNCNLCVASCPGRCLTASYDTMKSYLTGYDSSETVRIGCSGCGHRVKIEEYCVASIPWEFLAWLAFRKHVVLYLPCETCEDSVARRLVDAQLDSLRHFFGEELFSSRFTLVRSGDDLPDEAEEERRMNRKELMSMMTSKVKNQALGLLADVDMDDYSGLFYRRLLRDTVYDLYTKEKAAGRKPVFEVKLPHYTAACYACQTCERLCPQKAVSYGALQDGKRGIYIEPWKCTGCEMCQVVCRDGGIDEFRFMKVPHLSRLLVTRVAAKLCANCQKPLKPDSTDDLCPFCRSRERIRPKNKGAN